MKLNFPTGTLAFTDATGTLWQADENGQCDIGDLDPVQFYSHGFYCTGISDGISEGGMTYVDLSASSLFVSQNAPYTPPTKFDFSADAASFAHVPKALVISVAVTFAIAATKDNIALTVHDSDAAGSGAMSAKEADLVSSVAGNAAIVRTFTATVNPYDFDGEVDFNVWLSVTAGAGITLTSTAVTVLGYWY
jgi:hypothetical protein